MIEFKQIAAGSIIRECVLNAETINNIIYLKTKYEWDIIEIEPPAYILMNISFNVIDTDAEFGTTSINKVGAWFNNCDELMIAIRKFYIETCNYYKTTDIISMKLTYLKDKKKIQNEVVWNNN